MWGFDLDRNPRQVKASIGIVPQEVNLDAFLSPKQLLERLLGMEKKKTRIRSPRFLDQKRQEENFYYSC